MSESPHIGKFSPQKFFCIFVIWMKRREKNFQQKKLLGKMYSAALYIILQTVV